LLTYFIFYYFLPIEHRNAALLQCLFETDRDHQLRMNFLSNEKIYTTDYIVDVHKSKHRIAIKRSALAELGGSKKWGLF